MAGIAVTSMELCGSCRCLHGLDEGMSVWAVPLGLALVVIWNQAKEQQTCIDSGFVLHTENDGLERYFLSDVAVLSISSRTYLHIFLRWGWCESRSYLKQEYQLRKGY